MLKTALKQNPKLILDGRKAHTLNVAVIEKARENGVTILCLPAHCSQCTQFLDASFMVPLFTYYTQEAKTFLRNNPGRVKQNQVATLFGKAYTRAVSPLKAIHGFEKLVFIQSIGEDMFALADTRDIPIQVASEPFTSDAFC